MHDPTCIVPLPLLKKKFFFDNKLKKIPVEIGNLVNLTCLCLDNNELCDLPKEIGNLVNLRDFDLRNNKLTKLPPEIVKIIKIININETSYDLNNIKDDAEILIFHDLKTELNNLPINLKELWLNENIINPPTKLPFNCKIYYYKKL